MSVRLARRTADGAAAVEFALVVPFLAMLLLGMVTTGLTYSDHLSITNAVREGARFGAASVYSQTSPAIQPSDWVSSVQGRVKDTYFNTSSTLNASDVCVQLVTDTGTVLTPTLPLSCGTAPASPSSMPSGSCAVKVWIRKPANITLVVAPTLTFNIGASSVSYYGRVAGSCSTQ